MYEDNLYNLVAISSRSSRTINMLMILVVIAIVSGILRAIKAKRLRRDGIIMEATINDIKSGIKNAIVYVKFRDEDGNLIETKVTAPARTYTIGESIDIIYLPGKSDTIHIYPGLDTNVILNCFVAVTGAIVLIWYILTRVG